jgi:hypothetical protein
MTLPLERFNGHVRGIHIYWTDSGKNRLQKAVRGRNQKLKGIAERYAYETTARLGNDYAVILHGSRHLFNYISPRG